MKVERAKWWTGAWGVGLRWVGVGWGRRTFVVTKFFIQSRGTRDRAHSSG